MEPYTCLTCNQTKSQGEFYPSYKTRCKSCYFKLNCEKRDRLRAVDVAEAKCVKCKLTKSADNFCISKRTNLLGVTCKSCQMRKPVQCSKCEALDEAHYNPVMLAMMEIWVSRQPEDKLRYIKKILMNS